MAAAAVTALLALLAANGSSPLDCVCRSVYQAGGEKAYYAAVLSNGEEEVWLKYCIYIQAWLVGSCEALEQSALTVPAAARLMPWDWRAGPPPAAGKVGGDCGAALAVIRGLTAGAPATGLTRKEVESAMCDSAYNWTQAWAEQGLYDKAWTEEMLKTDHLRHPKLSQLLQAVRRILREIKVMQGCLLTRYPFPGYGRWLEAELEAYLQAFFNYYGNTGRLLPPLATHLSQLFIPLVFEHLGNHRTGRQLSGWINAVEHVGDMLHTKLLGLALDAQILSEQIAKYKLEEDKNAYLGYIIRRPLVSDRLLDYQERLLFFREDFGALCEQHQPNASQVFGLVDAIYSFLRHYIFRSFIVANTRVETTDEEWQLEDQSQAEVWVDTGCLQLLADSIDHPRCPLEELPLEARQCRERLWRDLVERPPRPPVTSYLAYSERTSVSLCLLAWMAANSQGVCQDVPYSVLQSVHDAACYFDRPHNQTCLQHNSTDAICSVSRGTLLFKCGDFSSVKTPNVCSIDLWETGHFSEIKNTSYKNKDYKAYGKATARTLSYKENLNSATLKYKDFKVDTLQTLEYSFISVNVLFRSLTASVYMWLPHLRNLPGKILLSFQLTGLAQVLFSEVVYRAAGFPDVSTAVLVDTSLTLLGCLWLNTFTFQMFACVRDLRLPDHLTLAEASIVFRSQLRWAMIPWAIISTACAALEKSSMHYLMYSRVTFIMAISSSVALNLVLLGLVACIYFCNKKSMRELNIIGDDKGLSKKKLLFMSVNTTILSGICVIIRIGFQQAKGLAQYVYFVHIATMLQGPVLFVFLACNGRTLPVLRKRLLALCRPDVYSPGVELCSAAERNLARRRGEPAETSL